MIALSVHNPEQVRVVDRVDERATLLLSRVEIKRSSHAGQIFAWLFAQCGGKAGTVRDVSLSQIVAAVDCSDRGARKWLELLEQRGLIAVPPIGSPERPKRLDPYVIHVLQSAPSVAQKTFEFMPEPVMPATVIRVMREDVPEASFGNTNDIAETGNMVESRGPAVRTKGTDQRYGPTVRESVVADSTPPLKENRRTEVVAEPQVDDSRLSLVEQLAQLSQRTHAGALKPQTRSNSLPLQTQTTQAKPLSQETRANGGTPRERAAERRLKDPETIGGAMAGVLTGTLQRLEDRLNDPGTQQREIQALVMAIGDLLPASRFPTLSRGYVDRVAEVAVVGHARVDQWRTITPAMVLAWARHAAKGDEPAACFHAKVNKEFGRRLLSLPRCDAKGGA